MRRFELIDGKSKKFWEIDREGASVTVRFGRMGTDGQTKTKTHPSEKEAVSAHDKLVSSKTKKGYSEVRQAKAKRVAETEKAAKTDEAAKTKDAPPTKEIAARPAERPTFDARALHRKIASFLRQEGTEKSYLRKPDDWLDRVKRAHARYGKGSPKDSLDLELEGAYSVNYYGIDELLGWWLTAEGPAFMVRAFFERWRYDPWGHSHPNLDDPYFCWAKRNGNAHRALRSMVSALDPASYASAVAAAGQLREAARLPMRCVISYAFPDEPTWAERDAREMLESFGHTRDAVSWHPVFITELIGSLRRVDLTTEILKKVDAHESVAFAQDMVDALGPETATGPMAVLLERSSGKDRKAVAELFATIAHEDAARALARHAHDKHCRKSVQAFADANPRLAAAALAEVVAGEGKAADAARLLLDKVARASLAEVESSRADASPRARDVIEQTVKGLGPKKEAPTSVVPTLLVSPPWARGESPATAPVIAGLEALAVEARIEWDPNQRDQYGHALPPTEPIFALSTLAGWGYLPKGRGARSAEMDAAVEKAVAAKSGDGYFNRLHYVSGFLHAASDAVALRIWNETSPEVLDVNSFDVAYVLERFGLSALPGTLAQVEKNPKSVLPIAAHVGASSLAERMADAHHRMKKAGAHARQWMDRFPEHAAIGLVPIAFSSKSEKQRAAACSALRYVATGHGDLLREVADRYGPKVREAVDTVLAIDPVEVFPAKIKKLPTWLDVAALPSPTIEGGVLPPESRTHLATMLSFSPLEAPYAGLAIVKETCDAPSLAAFSWALFQQWLLAGGSGKDDWAMLALGHFGDDEVARRLAPLVRAWPGESAHARAVKGLDVLAAIGTDIALMHLAGIANKVRFKGLQAKARERIDQIAEARGLTPEELGDRLVPDLDLDPNGSRELSFGARTFRVGFDETLTPFVIDEAGKARKSLPKPNKSDDAETANASAKIWKTLKKDARAIAADQVFRLEHAMCAGRTWDASTFRTFLVEHPLVIHLLRRLVLATTDGSTADGTFMVDEERSFVDPNDDPFVLDDDATVMIVHPLALDDALRRKWGARLGDYELIPPFPQLGREVFALEPADVVDDAIVRFQGATVKTGHVLGLEKRGWKRGFPQDAGWIWDIHKPLGGGVEATLHLRGGLLAGDLRESPEDQELGTIVVRKEHTYDDAGVVKPAELAPATYSELLRDIEQLRDAAR